MELPLVLFTVLSQAAVGMVLMSAVRGFAGHHGGSARNEWTLVAGLMGLGIVASLFHLGHPLEAYRALAHLEKAWLSREVLAAGVFLALAAVAAVAGIGKGALLWGAILAGLATVLASGMTYAPPAFPALNNALPTVFFLISAVVLGAGFASWFAAAGSQTLLARICATALVTGLVVRLAVPCVWLSGGEIMRQSGLAWLDSPLYWANIAVMAACLGVLWKNRTIPSWLPILALLGELAGRAAFFAETVHTAMNIGNPY
ncbi:dimethyl sulfoxide reductase anchor subunit family protein [Desulfomicrobium escambiense]|uniref:dimethyl sulfoxide reductase anchor subunit family protein n=1 Tax=Desulfomicrobium escambiense TaxID=29503 RepID=UPI00316ACA33